MSIDANLLIRPFGCLMDARACADIAIACWNHNTADRVIEQITDGVYFVAVIDGVVVGFVGARRSYLVRDGWEIPWIAVSPDHHGQNIGANLLRHMIGELNQRRATLVTLATQHPAFFEKAGFDTVETYNEGWSLMTLPMRLIFI